MAGDRRVLVVYTGGTIGMIDGPRGYVPVRGHLGGFLERMPQFHEPGQTLHTTPPSRFGRRIQYDIHEFEEPLDSSNMDMDDWVMLAKVLEDHYDDYDGFVVLHGTDTMAYTASALSFMLENLNKTVILTGSQIPLSQVRSDAVENLLGALTIAGHFEIPEVGLYFHNRLMRGNRCRKMDAAGFNAFDSPNYETLVDVGIEIQVHWDRIQAPPEGTFRVRPITHPYIAALRLYPGMGAQVLQNFLQPPTQGLVIETYGSGNAPDTNPHFLQALKEATERGVMVVNCTQCARGTVKADYAAGVALTEAGVISGRDMTPEAALTKMSWLLSQGLETPEIRAAMQRDLRGELTAPSSNPRFSLREGQFIRQVAEAMDVATSPQAVAGLEKALFPVLMCAAAHIGDVDALRRMIGQGAQVNMPDYDGRVPLHLAAAEGKYDAVAFLIGEGADLHAEDRWGHTPLRSALRRGHDDTASLLAQKGARLAPHSVVTDLCHHASRGELTPLQRLLRYGADPSRSDYDRRTPLHLAAAEGHLAIVEQLIASGAPVHVQDRWGHMPLDDALRQGHLDVAHRLRHAQLNASPGPLKV